MICPVTLGAKGALGTYFAALCRVSEPHERHVFELFRGVSIPGGPLVVVVDPYGRACPPELLDRAEAALAAERASHQAERDRIREAASKLSPDS